MLPSQREMVKIKMPMISKAVLIMSALINKGLHLKSDNSKLLRTCVLSTLLSNCVLSCCNLPHRFLP